MTDIQFTSPCQNTVTEMNLDARAAPLVGGGVGGAVAGVLHVASSVHHHYLNTANDDVILREEDHMSNGTQVVRYTNQTTGAVVTQSEFDAMTVQATTLIGGGAANTPVEADDLTETIEYSETLGPGTYTRATLLASMAGVTAVVAYSITVATGTATFSDLGPVADLAAGSIVDRPAANGLKYGDFTVTVDAASTIYLIARGI